MKARDYHDFFAPIGGIACRFTMRCDNGKPVWIQCAEPPEPHEDRVRLVAHLDLINHLLKSLPWPALAWQRTGDIGAVIEAADARRQEIYGDLREGAA